MVIPTCRRSPACRGLGADAPGVLQRAAELIPNQLRFSAPPTLHPLALIPVESDSGRTDSTACPALLAVDVRR
jgi:hypothetical protein